MTADELAALTPTIEALQKRGVIATWSAASWPTYRWAIEKTENAGNASPTYTHAFRIRSHGLTKPIEIEAPFTEETLVRRLALAEAREKHAAAVEVAYFQSKDALIRDLAAIYESRLWGRELPVPTELTVTNLKVNLQ